MLLALAVLLVAAPAKARAPEAPMGGAVLADGARLLVVPEPDASNARIDELYAGLRAAGLSLVEADERAGVDRPPTPPAKLGVRDQARAHIAQARARYHELELEQAKSAADEALDELVRLERPEDALELFEEALLVRVTAVLAMGGDVDADLTLLARLLPEREQLNLAVHPPSLVEAYARARQAAQSAPPGILELRPRVAGFLPAQVLIDGRPRLGLVAQGAHLLIVRAEGAATFARIIEVSAEPLVLEPFLATRDAAAQRAVAVEAARAAATDLERTAALDRLATLCAARGVVLVTDTGALLFVRDPGDGRAPLSPLAIDAGADGATIGTATLAALQAPAKRQLGLPPGEEGLPPLLVWAAWTTGVPLIGGLLGLGVWSLWPHDAWPNEPAPAPARPVAFSCCVD